MNCTPEARSESARHVELNVDGWSKVIEFLSLEDALLCIGCARWMGTALKPGTACLKAFDFTQRVEAAVDDSAPRCVAHQANAALRFCSAAQLQRLLYRAHSLCAATMPGLVMQREHMSAFAAAPRESLRALCIRECPEIDGSAIRALHRACPNLTHLDIARCTMSTGLLAALEVLLLPPASGAASGAVAANALPRLHSLSRV